MDLGELLSYAIITLVALVILYIIYIVRIAYAGVV